MFLWDNRFHDNISKIIDFDAEIKIMSLSNKYKHCVHNGKNKGFASVLQKGKDCFCERCFIYLTNLIQNNIMSVPDINLTKLAMQTRDKLIDDHGYLTLNKIKEIAYELYYKGKFKRSRFFNKLAAFLFQQPLKTINIYNQQVNITKATCLLYTSPSPRDS